MKLLNFSKLKVMKDLFSRIDKDYNEVSVGLRVGGL